MKLAAKDFVEEVYYHKNMVESTIVYKEKDITLNSIKLLKRDSKGVKLRV